MRHEIRLLDQNLPGFARELAQACWSTVDTRLSEPPGQELYRRLTRAVRQVLRKRVMAFRYCGAATSCEDSLYPRNGAIHFAHEKYAGERVRVFLTDAETPPETLAGEILRDVLRAVVAHYPGRRLPGMATALRRQIERVFRGRMYRSDRCGVSPLCGMNEAYDPWDLTDPLNAEGAGARHRQALS